jgi:hypothetical protein
MENLEKELKQVLEKASGTDGEEKRNNIQNYGDLVQGSIDATAAWLRKVKPSGVASE